MPAAAIPCSETQEQNCCLCAETNCCSQTQKQQLHLLGSADVLKACKAYVGSRHLTRSPELDPAGRTGLQWPALPHSRRDSCSCPACHSRTSPAQARSTQGSSEPMHHMSSEPDCGLLKQCHFVSTQVLSASAVTAGELLDESRGAGLLGRADQGVRHSQCWFHS